MLNSLLSGDFPRSRLLTVLLIISVLGLLLTPFIFPGARAMNVGAKICIFIVLVAAFDLMLGYTGILSFAHTMFYGIGAYGVALACEKLGPTWESVAIGTLAGVAVSGIVALIISLFSLRVRTLYFAMITLAVAAAFHILCSQLSEITGGEDGINFSVPDIIHPSTVLSDTPFLGVEVTGQLVAYYGLFVFAAICFLFILRVVNSPFGRVLQAIRDNEFRAAALGYRVVVFRATSSVLGCMFAALAGSMLALWLRYNGPGSTLGFDIMMDILLIVVIGGMATMYGAVIGAVLYIIAQNYLQDVLKMVQPMVDGVPVISGMLHPDRWLLWMGILFILCVYYFPWGMVGKLRMRALGIK